MTPSLSYGAAYRPFQKSFWNQPLPDNALIDVTSPQVVAEVVAQSKIGAPNLNIGSWTAEPTVVPLSQPLVPVATTHDPVLTAIFNLGVPIPPGTRPTNDGDATLTIWQPDWVCPLDATIRGRYYELWATAANVDVNGLEHWSCRTGARYVNVNDGTSVSSYSWKLGPGGTQYASNPDSTYTDNPYIQGSGIAFMPGVLSLTDMQRGYVDHTLLFDVSYCRRSTNVAPGFVWPATRTDGWNDTSLVREGQRLRLPPGFQIPSGLHPLARLIAQGARDYGLCVTDQTASNIAFRAAPSGASYLGGTPAWSVLNGFPWSSLGLLVAGTAAVPTPVG